MSTDITDITTNNAQIPDNYLAALDIGSNSFHFVYARLHNDHIQILHTEKYRVKLADGLDDNNRLSSEAIERGIATLTNLASTTHKLDENNFRVVATYTLRQAENSQEFLEAAAKVFPFNIEIISGHEEARLIYQGVAHYSEPTLKQLIIDIGGGSTECIIGQQQKIFSLASLNMGCVNLQKKYFKDKAIKAKYFKKAILAAKREIESIVNRFKLAGWKTVTGTSGTIKNIHRIINIENSIPTPITLEHLYELRQTLVDFGDVDNLDIKGLKDNRRDVVCSGVALLIALMEMLDINEVHYCEYALREGVLYEQLDVIHCHSIKQHTVDNLCLRFAIDTEQANNVSQLALAFYQQIAKDWKINKTIYRELLSWAANLHELGIDINPSGYHKHGEYIIANADLPGFNQEQQTALAWLIGNQRKKVTPAKLHQWYVLNKTALSKICCLLRLSILLCQQRQLSLPPQYQLSASDNELEVAFPEQWLVDRPLVDIDLFYEQETLLALNIELKVSNALS